MRMSWKSASGAASATIASAMARTSVRRFRRAERSWIERMRAACEATDRYSRAFWMATAAWSAKACTSATSSSGHVRSVRW